MGRGDSWFTPGLAAAGSQFQLRWRGRGTGEFVPKKVENLGEPAREATIKLVERVAMNCHFPEL